MDHLGSTEDSNSPTIPSTIKRARGSNLARHDEKERSARFTEVAIIGCGTAASFVRLKQEPPSMPSLVFSNPLGKDFNSVAENLAVFHRDLVASQGPSDRPPRIEYVVICPVKPLHPGGAI